MTPTRRASDRLTFGDLLTGALGLLVLAGGIVLFIHAIRQKQTDVTHLAFAFGAVIFGAGMLRPDPVFDRLKRMAGVARGVWRRDSTNGPAVGP